MKCYLIVLFNSDDDISLFVSFINISMSFDNLFQRIASIDDRFDTSRLDNLFKVS